MYKYGGFMKLGKRHFWSMGTMLVLVLTFLIISLYPLAATVYNYWRSNDTAVAKWLTTPTISNVKLNSNNNFPFEVAYMHARSQWGGAGINTTLNGTSWASNIVCYGGTRSQILAGANLVVTTSDAGACFGGSTFYQNITANGMSKQLKYQSTTQQVCIVDANRTTNAYKNVFTHEVGHALGWLGHSNFSNDIMWTTISEIFNLTSYEKNHLSQFY